MTLQRLYTIEISAENELEARTNANLFASGHRAPEFQPQVSEPRSKPIQSSEAMGLTITGRDADSAFLPASPPRPRRVAPMPHRLFIIVAGEMLSKF